MLKQWEQGTFQYNQVLKWEQLREQSQTKWEHYQRGWTWLCRGLHGGRSWT
jgi:hypothetical protein